MDGAIRRAREISANIAGAWSSEQFSNPDNPEAHYLSTGPEIYTQLAGRVDVLVAGVGTGGTFSGTTRFLKTKNPHLKAFAMEPAQTFVLRGGKASPHRIAGISPGFVPANFQPSLCDGIIAVEETEAIATTNLLSETEGLQVNISSAANVAAALQLATRKEFSGRNIVTFVCDEANIDERIRKIQQFYEK